MFHSGINKNLSNEAIFDTYDVSVKVINVYSICSDSESQNVASLLRPPIKTALNKDTIYDCVSAIIKWCKNSQDSSYTKISNFILGCFSLDSITTFRM